MKATTEFRSAQHKRAYHLRYEKHLKMAEIGKILNCSAANVSLMIKMAHIPKQTPGKPAKWSGASAPISLRTSKALIDAIRRAATKHKITISNEIERRIIPSLMEDGMLPKRFIEAYKAELKRDIKQN